MERVTFLGLPDCFRVSNGTVELIVTTGVGPRVLRYGFVGGENVLGEHPAASVQTELGEWKPWGGHRLWTAPESRPHSYAPDNDPVAYEVEDERTIRLTRPAHPGTGIEKELTVSLDPEGTGVRLLHKIVNRNPETVVAAPWALTIMRGGGEAVFPQEPYRPHSEHLLPARPLVLWHYTDLTDARLRLGRQFIRLRADEQKHEPQKIGLLNKQGWAAYGLRDMLFVKRFRRPEDVAYPDYGCNNEAFTAGSFIEVETLGPLSLLEPGTSAEHVERWHLFGGVPSGETEDEIEAAFAPLLAQTEAETAG